MTNETTLQENHFKEHLNKSRDVIINHIRKIHPNSKIQVMTNKSDALNRGKHFGAHICVDSNHYYYITFSRKDELCEHYFSINTNLLRLLKHCNEDWHLLLISNGKVHTFDAKTIVENAQLFNESTYKVPLSAKSSTVEADFRYAYKKSECIIDFTFLGNVRYSKKFDMHKKQVTISAPDYRFKRTYSSQVEAYNDLTGTRTVNGKPEGKPVSNAAYFKSYKQFLRDIRDNKLYLINDKGTSFPVSVVTESVDTNVSTSLLVVNQSTTNSDVDIASDVNDNCNIDMAADKQPNKSKAVKKEKLAKEDRQMEILAQKMTAKQDSVSEQEIKKTVLNIGSNRNMLEAYVDSLNEKHLHKEAVYAATLFDLLNTVKL